MTDSYLEVWTDNKAPDLSEETDPRAIREQHRREILEAWDHHRDIEAVSDEVMLPVSLVKEHLMAAGAIEKAVLDKLMPISEARKVIREYMKKTGAAYKAVKAAKKPGFKAVEVARAVKIGIGTVQHCLRSGGFKKITQLGCRPNQKPVVWWLLESRTGNPVPAEKT